MQLEANDDNLIKKSTFNIKKTIIKSVIGNILKILMFMLVFGLICFNIEKLNPLLEKGVISDNLMFILVIILGFGFMIWFTSISLGSIKLFSYLLLKSNSYGRTDIGEEVNKKIEGLKNYINDFSILDEREQHELMIWEDYLIYSVLFNQNDKVINELSSLVEAEIEVGKVYFGYVDSDNGNVNK